MLRLFAAAPSYYGGKRKLASRILSYAEGETFIDAFLGGGSVSLLAKAKGFRVLCNDIADRSAVIGKALIENPDVKITDADIYRLFELTESDNFLITNYSQFYTTEIGEFLDTAWANIKKFEDPTKAVLMKLLWIKTAIFYRPMGGFTHTNAVAEMLKAENDAELTDTLLDLKEDYSRPLLHVLKDLAGQINDGVIDNGFENECHQLDVCEFLKKVQGDTVYIDPPYYGAQSYEKQYHVLDCLLKRAVTTAENSRFNEKNVMQNTLGLFEAAAHIPKWIISVGQKTITKMGYIDMVKQFKSTVRDIKIEHRYTFGGNVKDDAHWHEVLLVAN